MPSDANALAAKVEAKKKAKEEAEKKAAEQAKREARFARLNAGGTCARGFPSVKQGQCDVYTYMHVDDSATDNFFLALSLC